MLTLYMQLDSMDIIKYIYTVCEPYEMEPKLMDFYMPIFANRLLDLVTSRFQLQRDFSEAQAEHSHLVEGLTRDYQDRYVSIVCSEVLLLDKSTCS